MMLDKFNEEQLEFIVNSVNEGVLQVAPRIFEFIHRTGRDDLLDILRVKWANAWLRRKLDVLPAECPKCGFNSLMPNLTCLVCGTSFTDREYKTGSNFMDEYLRFLKGMSCEELERLRKYDYVLVDGAGIKPPWEDRIPIDIEIYLGSKDKQLLKKVYSERCGSDKK